MCFRETPFTALQQGDINDLLRVSVPVQINRVIIIIWYVVMARDLYLRSVLATNSLWTQLLYIVRSCSSARECCST